MVNLGIDFNADYLQKGFDICKSAYEVRAEEIKRLADLVVGSDVELSWLCRAVSCIDLTTLSGDDTPAKVSRLYYKAKDPVPNISGLMCAAVCVYPSRVSDLSLIKKRFNKQSSDLPRIASVATGFPSGQYSLPSRLLEISFAVESGADEIDIVINREMVLRGDWRGLFEEIRAMKIKCKSAHMKAILAVGELGSLSNVYNAGLVAMMAGADFIKTSTGKEAQFNADVICGIAMAMAIRDYEEISGGICVGLKPAGGVSTHLQAMQWLMLVKSELGETWCCSELFRIGASSLLESLKKRISVLMSCDQFK